MNKLINKISKMNRTSLIGSSILLLCFIGFIDWSTGTELSISIFYLIPIAICAWFVNKWTGVVLAIISITIWFLSDYFDSSSYNHPITPYWNALIMLGIFVLVSELLSALKRVIDRENILALNIQKNLLPGKNPEISDYKVFSIWEPTRVVSGDYYDFIQLKENVLGISLADVCGHGFPAALLMSNVQATFRIIAGHNHAPKEVCDHLNSILISYNMPDKFTSFFYGILDAENKEFTYSNAGHPPPIILRANGKIDRLSVGGFLLGVNPIAKYEQETVYIESGDIILLY
ncbi:MAG TPA: SpoIIE family protein phosphatase, partial [Ignavibacteriaceae bacterium]